MKGDSYPREIHTSAKQMQKQKAEGRSTRQKAEAEGTKKQNAEAEAKAETDVQEEGQRWKFGNWKSEERKDAKKKAEEGVKMQREEVGGVGGQTEMNRENKREMKRKR